MQWIMQEPGWYTSEIGGIVSDGKRWWFYPRGREDSTKAGPWTTLKRAQAGAVEVLDTNGDRG
jgi:hypothetical protein